MWIWSKPRTLNHGGSIVSVCSLFTYINSFVPIEKVNLRVWVLSSVIRNGLFNTWKKRSLGNTSFLNYTVRTRTDRNLSGRTIQLGIDCRPLNRLCLKGCTYILKRIYSYRMTWIFQRCSLHQIRLMNERETLKPYIHRRSVFHGYTR